MKKAQGISVNTIIIAAIVLLFLVVLSVIYIGGFRDWVGNQTENQSVTENPKIFMEEDAESITIEYMQDLMEGYPTAHSLREIYRTKLDCPGCYKFIYRFLVDTSKVTNICGYETILNVEEETRLEAEIDSLTSCVEKCTTSGCCDETYSLLPRIMCIGHWEIIPYEEQKGELECKYVCEQEPLINCSSITIMPCPVDAGTCDILTDVSICESINIDKGECILKDEYTTPGEMGKKVYQKSAEIWCNDE